ncbi:MAG: RHS repeat-associated core domain-containing protein [Deltaproteobacteria bacterium]|nr:RHS repeat-associated core domain-containing protein [Deltaproteobacteria bacterium]
MNVFQAARCTAILTAAILLVAGLVTTAPLDAMHPNLPLGFDAERSYQSTLEIDQVDLFSGRLSAVVPIGPFSMVYGSNVWRYAMVEESGTTKVRATPDPKATAGFGWHLGWGEVYGPQHAYNDTGRWLYVGEDGGRHTFYQTLHKGENDGDNKVQYSRDGSYLRLRKWNNFYVDIEFPDGTTRRFDSGNGGNGTTYPLTKVWSSFASAEDPDLSIAYNANDTLRTVTDRYGRTHYVHLTDEYAWIDRVVTQVDLEGVAGQRVFYDFTYSNINLDVSCKDTSTSTPNRIRVPHLTRLDLPDGTAYRMQDGAGEPAYENVCQGGIQDLPGVLNRVELPTGGALSWTWQEFDFPPSESNSPFNASAGVATRSLIAADGTVHGAWRYKTTKVSAATTGGHPELHTEVVQPTGDCTKHYFDAIYWRSPSTGEGWERGLPFVYTDQVDGRYLSSEVYPTNNGNGSCAGAKLRSTYLRYRRDQTPGPSAPLEDWTLLNRAVSASRVIYHDDGDRYADVDLSDFDGLGSFRRVITTGTFRDDSTDAELREVFTHFNRVDGTYFAPGYAPPAPADPWVLGIYDYTETTENEAVGEITSRVEYGFEADTGFLTCTRAIASGVQRSSKDLLATFSRSPLGLVTDAKLYGGDLQSLGTSGDDCGTVPTQPVYWRTHAYQAGVRVSTRSRAPRGGFAPFFSYDVDIDPSTGLVLTQRDSAGFSTTYTYEAFGRPLTITPQDGARTRFVYTNSGTGVSASLRTLSEPNGGGTPLTEQELILDDFGRSRLVRRKLPGGGWSERETTHNARGWVTAVSQWGDLAASTDFLDFDAFGRPGTIRPADGAGHDVRLTYAGDRQTIREAKIALVGGEGYATTTRRVDRYGRLRQVDEPAGPAGATVTTLYSYDVGDRLTEIVSGNGPTQTRSLVYDNRGFLLSETHPEKGPSGNGVISYVDYDAAGVVHRRTDGPHDLKFEFDPFGRRTAVRDLGQGSRLVTEYAYDGGLGFGLGKLWTTTRHNYLDLPWNSAGEEEVKIQQVFGYQGVGGRTSSKETKVLWSEDDVTFHQAFGYDLLGNIAQQTYPSCDLPACTAGAGPGRQVSTLYDQGMPIAVPGWASAINYHSSGLWKEIHHANGVVDHQDLDPAFSSRTGRLYTTGVNPASQNFDSGALLYDGAGNVKAMGSGTFAYDSVSRLVDASYFGGTWGQAYSYDSFGNLTQVIGDTHQMNGTVDYSVDPATNRLTGAVTYDAAGNLTSSNGQQFTYDTSNRVIRQASLFYLYDAVGERVASIPDFPFGPTATFHLRDLSQQVVSRIELNASGWSRDRDYVYSGNRRLAWAGASAISVHHSHPDHLGSPRLITQHDGSVSSTHFFNPYGEEPFSTASDDPMRFTGHERDISTGADYMHARHYQWSLGRFLSVDPLRGTPGQPQSLNRYAYGVGNPLSRIDPDGRQDMDVIEVVAPYWRDTVDAGPPSGGIWDVIAWIFDLFPDPDIVPVPSGDRELPNDDSLDPEDIEEEQPEVEEDSNTVISFDCDAVLKPTVGVSASLGVFKGLSASISLRPPNAAVIRYTYGTGGGGSLVSFAGFTTTDGKPSGWGEGGTATYGMPAGLNVRSSANISETGSSAFFGGGPGFSSGLSGTGGVTYTQRLYDNPECQ